ncbi:ribonuclease III [Spongiibacter sp. IMCC21906]|uniref:ribonuclease III n=1 Tax=Spongiibacter sp. IMCC21906 TaxID=1620392 RepID=UPI00062DCC56|nr:ribonuclease III [Spongiibacter sp. IMCC21906]AKH69509.1 ribonuclease III [Spongiibacter sp. IMCC21906]
MVTDKQSLFDRIDYQFQDPTLVDVALTHRSFAAENNERLEFLGDSLLNMIIAEALYLKFPSVREGELSRMRAGLVNGETLAVLGQEFALGDYLRLGSGESNTGGRYRESILADTVEALIGAIYLESGFESCRTKVLQWYGARLDKVNPKASHKDAKTLLQEFLQARKQSLPNYQLVETTGAEHEQVFTVACQVDMLSSAEVASGQSRRRAEQAAAEKVLHKLQNQH